MKIQSLIFYFIVVQITSIKSDEKSIFDCFYTDQVCPNSNVKYYLYTHDTADSPMELSLANTSDINSEIFVPNTKLIIILHGYKGHRDKTPNPMLRSAFFQRDNFNIISVDFEKLVEEPCYITAVGNLPTVANCTANLIDFLVDSNFFTLDDIHVIGFSLGAQAAGMISNYLSHIRKLKRITGLDPAKPLFMTASESNRLDPSDAEFVEYAKNKLVLNFLDNK